MIMQLGLSPMPSTYLFNSHNELVVERRKKTNFKIYFKHMEESLKVGGKKNKNLKLI